MQTTSWSSDHRSPMPAEEGVPAPEDAAPVASSGVRPQHAGELDFPPALRNAGRILAALTGVAAGAAMLFFGGLYAVFTSCAGYDGTGSGCGDASWLVESLELVAVLGGTAAAIIGGIGTAVTAKARWIGVGVSITFVLVLLLAVLLGMQETTLN